MICKRGPGVRHFFEKGDKIDKKASKKWTQIQQWNIGKS